MTVMGHWPAGRRLEHVRSLNTFGEALLWDDVPRLRTLIRDDAVLISKYGTSEAVGGLLRHVIPASMPLGTGRVPLGSVPGPLVEPGGVRLEPLGGEPGAPREIVVTGHVASGYLSEPELTARTFGIDPDGTRWWRSGDLAEASADGVFRHLGRVDDLVKIRGQLVEPSESDRVLRSIPGIRRVLVQPQTAADGSARLVAHLEVDADSGLTAAQVRTRLSSSMAPHQVPSVLVRHDRLPLNDRGKTDRAALRALPAVPWLSSAPRPSASDPERFAALAAGQVLGTVVHPDDDLWELGLDSLASVELGVILAEAGWTDLEPTALLEHRTPAALARLRDADRSARRPVVVIHPDGRLRPIICIPGAGGTALAFRWLARELGEDQPLVVVEPVGLHSPGRPDRTVEQAAGRALDEIDRLPDLDPAVIVGYSAGGAIAYEIAGRLAGRGRSVHAVLLDTAVARPAGSSRPGTTGTDATDTRRSDAAGPDTDKDGPGAVATARRAAVRTWLRVFPASTVPPTQRYRAYYHLGVRAQDRYRPQPPTFPVTHLRPRGSALRPDWAALIDGMALVGGTTLAGGTTLPDGTTLVGRTDVVAVDGDHYSMLEPPQVAGLAEGIRRVAAAAGRQPAER